MIAYKPFEMWICESDGTNIVKVTDIVLSIVSQNSVLQAFQNADLNTASNYIDACTPERLAILSYSSNYSATMTAAIQQLFPGLYAYDASFVSSYTGKKIKLLNKQSGNYMLSILTISGSSGAVSGQYYIYNTSGRVLATMTLYTTSGNSPFLAITDFDGTVPNTGYLYVYSQVSVDSSGRYSAINVTNYRITLSSDLADWWNAVTPPPSDPYAPGGDSETGGGTGNFDLSSDQIDVPNVPTLSAVDTGLVTLYTPTLAQLQALAQYLWNANATTIDWWKKLIANPLDLILGLSIVPVAVPQGATENVRVGLIDTGVAMTKAASQYVQVDCGSLNITEFYGAALDYLPFRKTSIYLPFIGTRTISTDDIMGKTVQVVYNIDLLSGALTAMVKCGDAVLYQYSGACNIAIPLSGQSFTDLALSTLQLAAGIGATVATGGAAAGVVAANAANSVMSMKPTIERAGGVSGAAGQLAVMRPYLIGEIPRQSVPKNYNQFAGYPSNISAVLGDLSGYTEVETIYIEGITATSDELNEIENLLKSGVYI